MTPYTSIFFTFSQDFSDHILLTWEMKFPAHQRTIHLRLTVTGSCMGAVEKWFIASLSHMIYVWSWVFSEPRPLITSPSSLSANISARLLELQRQRQYVCRVNTGSAENIWWHLHLLRRTGGDQSAGERHGNDAADQWEDQQHGAEAS